MRIKAKFIPLGSNLHDQHCLPMNKSFSSFADDGILSVECEIFVHSTEEVYMFDMSWRQLS